MTNSLESLLNEAKQSAFVMEYISGYTPDDIDSDDVDLRFEMDGVDTGCDASIVDQCGKAATVIDALIAALEQAQQQVEKLEAECDRNYINGMKTGWNYCDAENSDGFNKCLELRRKGVFEAAAVNPVKLPSLVNESNLPFAAMGWNAYRTDVVKVLHAAGIQVEGE